MRRRPSLIIAANLLLIAWISGHAQIKDQKIFDFVPVDQRPRFVARLKLYIEYSLTNQQSKLEELYSETDLCGLCKGKRECVDNCRPPMTLQVPEGFTSIMVALTPTKVAPYSLTKDWGYYIDADRKERVSWKAHGPRVVKDKVRLFAVHENGDWFFSLLSIGPLIEL
jgi:hypothetical protein